MPIQGGHANPEQSCRFRAVRPIKIGHAEGALQTVTMDRLAIYRPTFGRCRVDLAAVRTG